MITAKSLATGGLGRFGNQCFTIAGCIGIAIKSGQPYAFPEWLTHDNAIFGQPVDNINDLLLKPLPNLYDHIDPFSVNHVFQDYGYFWGWKEVYLPAGNWSIDAHMQSEKLFKHCLPLIRETFTFKGELEQNDCVAIHFRAGDYIDNPDAYHPRCSKEYYLEAMRLFPEGTRFIIFTDDPKAAMMTIPDGRIYSGSNYFEMPIYAMGNYIDQFKQMKKCKSFITANSSFSLMAAILGDHPEKKIICPARWFGSQAGDIETKDLYPENSIII